MSSAIEDFPVDIWPWKKERRLEKWMRSSL
jgi:hypothetical protein